MVLSVIAHIFALLLELVRISRISDHDKDLEILVLRYQLGIADRKLNRTIKPERIEKLTLAVLATRLKSRTNRTTNQLQHTFRIFSPRTVIRWHNELVKRKWTYARKNKGGRPRISQDVEALSRRCPNPTAMCFLQGTGSDAPPTVMILTFGRKARLG